MNEIAFCPDCGRRREGDTSFCAGCGRRLGPTQGQVSEWFTTPYEAWVVQWIALPPGLIGIGILVWYVWGIFAGHYLGIPSKFLWFLRTGWDFSMDWQDWVAVAALVVASVAGKAFEAAQKVWPHFPDRPAR